MEDNYYIDEEEVNLDAYCGCSIVVIGSLGIAIIYAITVISRFF